MPIPFTCPHCGHATEVGDRYAGQTGPCASCGAAVTIPQPEGKPIESLPAKVPAKSSAGLSLGLVIAAVLGLTLVCGGFLAALLLPAVQSAREAARRASCSNNLKQIGLALHNYHDVYNTFPAAFIADQEGQPMRSWRASILPFVEQLDLYERYDFHERWDAAENAFAINTPLPVYTCPTDPIAASTFTETSYVLVTGPGTVFEVDRPHKIANIRDGTSNTVLAVEIRNSGIHWSEPKDLDIEEFVALFGPNGTGPQRSPHYNGAHVLVADGSVRFLRFDTFPPESARAVATCNGLERVKFDD